MTDYTVKLEGTDELIANLSRISADIRGEVARKAVNAGGIQIENRAKINAPVKTGALWNSAKTIARNTPEGAEAEIGFRGLVYARIQEFGGTIHARNAKYLRFRYKGRWVSRKSVRIRAKRYLRSALDTERGLAVKAMSDVVRAYLGK